MEEEIDLLTSLICDTYLTVKITMYNGSPGFVHYIIPRKRKDGTERLFGDLWKYFTQQDNFRFAVGYILEEDLSGRYWAARSQYFYFDKRNLPFLKAKFLRNFLVLPKNPKEKNRPHLFPTRV